MIDLTVSINPEAKIARDVDIMAIQESLQKRIAIGGHNGGGSNGNGGVGSVSNITGDTRTVNCGCIASLALEQDLDKNLLSTSSATRLVQHV